MAFDPWTVGLTVLGGLFGARSSSKAADANVEAQREQLALQERMFQQTRQDYKPWMDAGVPALNEMMRMVGLGGTSGGVPSLGQSVGGTGGLPTNGGDPTYSSTGLGSRGSTFGGSTGLPPGTGGLNAPGSEMPGVGTGWIHRGQAAGTHSGMSIPNQFRQIGQQFGIGGGPQGVTYSPEGDATMQEQMQGAPVFRPQEYNANGRRVSAMGTTPTQRGAGMAVAEITPEMLASLNDASTPHVTPIMAHAASDFVNRAAITPRYTGGPMEKGRMYSVAELEPEMVTTPQGSQLVTQPSIMQATQPGYVTPGPIGQSMQSSGVPSLSQSLQTNDGYFQPPSPMGAGINNAGVPQVGGYTPNAPPTIQGQFSPSPVASGVETGGSGGMMQGGPQGGGFGDSVVNYPSPPQAAYPNTPAPPPSGIMQNAPGSFPAIGVTTTPQLQQDPYSFMSDDPSYGFRFQEGQRALESSAAARGGLLSGGTAKRLNRYGQDFASNEFMNRFNRLATISGMGQTMTQGMGQLGQGYGGQMGNIIGGMGQTRASGYLGQGSAMNQSLQNLAFLNAYRRPGGP